jgi:ketosteroid isomerase-like protein
MSTENVDTLLEGLEAFNSRDIERILGFLDPDFETVVPPSLSAEPDTYRGHDGARRYFESFWETMDEVRFRPERFWDADESVVVAMRLTAKGRRTRIAVEQRFAQVWTFRDGKATRARTYASDADALKAAGLGDV